MRILAATCLVAVALAGCTTPGTGAPEAGLCSPEDGDDPYPSDEIFAERSADVAGDVLELEACLVNGQDEHHREDCGSGAGPIRVKVRNASSGELVYSRPYEDEAFIAACQEWTLDANAEWEPARFADDWDLRKDVCGDDGNCTHDGEGERVPGGDYVVRIAYPSFVEDWKRTVRLPSR